MLMIKQFLITRMHLKQKELRIRILCKSETQRPVHVQRLTQNLLTIHRLRMMEMMTIHQAAEQAARPMTVQTAELAVPLAQLMEQQ